MCVHCTGLLTILACMKMALYKFGLTIYNAIIIDRQYVVNVLTL